MILDNIKNDVILLIAEQECIHDVKLETLKSYYAKARKSYNEKDNNYSVIYNMSYKTLCSHMKQINNSLDGANYYNQFKSYHFIQAFIINRLLSFIYGNEKIICENNDGTAKYSLTKINLPFGNIQRPVFSNKAKTSLSRTTDISEIMLPSHYLELYAILLSRFSFIVKDHWKDAKQCKTKWNYILETSAKNISDFFNKRNPFSNEDISNTINRLYKLHLLRAFSDHYYELVSYISSIIDNNNWIDSIEQLYLLGFDPWITSTKFFLTPSSENLWFDTLLASCKFKYEQYTNTLDDLKNFKHITKDIMKKNDKGLMNILTKNPEIVSILEKADVLDISMNSNLSLQEFLTIFENALANLEYYIWRDTLNVKHTPYTHTLSKTLPFEKHL